MLALKQNGDTSKQETGHLRSQRACSGQVSAVLQLTTRLSGDHPACLPGLFNKCW